MTKSMNTLQSQSNHFLCLLTRCEDFISMCEVHRRFLFSGSGYPDEKKCCGTLFNPVPFFSHTGTCFTTHATVYERSPFTFSSIKVWLNVETKNSPGETLSLIATSSNPPVT